MSETETRHFVICHSCGEKHAAEYSHEGRHNEGPIFAVVCTVDYLTDYYTSEVVESETHHVSTCEALGIQLRSTENEQPVSVEIVAVKPDAVRIPAYRLKEGDFVFDTTGGTHRIERVRRSAKSVDFKRADRSHFERLSIDESITVIKGDS